MKNDKLQKDLVRGEDDVLVAITNMSKIKKLTYNINTPGMTKTMAAVRELTDCLHKYGTDYMVTKRKGGNYVIWVDFKPVIEKEKDRDSNRMVKGLDREY